MEIILFIVILICLTETATISALADKTGNVGEIFSTDKVGELVEDSVTKEYSIGANTRTQQAPSKEKTVSTSKRTTRTTTIELTTTKEAITITEEGLLETTTITDLTTSESTSEPSYTAVSTEEVSKTTIDPDTKNVTVPKLIIDGKTSKKIISGLESKIKMIIFNNSQDEIREIFLKLTLVKKFNAEFKPVFIINMTTRFDEKQIPEIEVRKIIFKDGAKVVSEILGLKLYMGKVFDEVPNKGSSKALVIGLVVGGIVTLIIFLIPTIYFRKKIFKKIFPGYSSYQRPRGSLYVASGKRGASSTSTVTASEQ